MTPCPRPQIPLAEATRDLPVWRRRGTASWLLHRRLGRSHLPASSCTSPRPLPPPERRNHARPATTQRVPPPQPAAGGRMRSSALWPFRAPPLFRGLREAPLRRAAPVAGNLRGRGGLCLCKLPKLRMFDNTAHHQEDDRTCGLLHSWKVYERPGTILGCFSCFDQSQSTVVYHSSQPITKLRVLSFLSSLPPLRMPETIESGSTLQAHSEVGHARSEPVAPKETSAQSWCRLRRKPDISNLVRHTIG